MKGVFNLFLVFRLKVCPGPFSPFAVARGDVAGPFLVFQLTSFPVPSATVLHTVGKAGIPFGHLHDWFWLLAMCACAVFCMFG